jgi:hypothetical protein
LNRAWHLEPLRRGRGFWAPTAWQRAWRQWLRRKGKGKKVTAAWFFLYGESLKIQNILDEKRRLKGRYRIENFIRRLKEKVSEGLFAVSPFGNG